jgi:hypothetical protein
LRTLAAIVSQSRPNLPAKEGLPPSLPGDLMRQIPCDAISLVKRYNCERPAYPFLQATGDGAWPAEDWIQAYWNHYWDCQPCSYPARTRDQRGVIKTAGFYSARQ